VIPSAAARPALTDATAGVATPALVVDLAAADRNIARAAAFFAERPTKLRPHFKAHKCTALLRRQVAAGQCTGVMCATAHEAEVLALAGFDDILVANQVADPRALDALARAAAIAEVTACVDSRRHVELLASTGARLGVLIEINVGQNRSGLPPGDPQLPELVQMIGAATSLRFRGLQGYEGHAVLLPNRDDRARQVKAAAEILNAERARVPCELVSGGGTGTYDLSADAGALDEVQAGSYVLMDASYDRLGLPFEQALFCKATVISRQGTRVVLDAGLKALSAEYGMPRADGIEIRGLSDEHATGTVTNGSELQVGDPVLLVPAHVDPTVNLHATLVAVAPDGTTEAWAIDGRR